MKRPSSPRRHHRRRWPLLLAVTSAVGLGAFGMTTSLVRRDTMVLPGAGLSLVAYTALGYFAVRGREWARWVFFSLILLTALTCTFFTFTDLSGSTARFELTPALAVISVLFAPIAIATALPDKSRASEPLAARKAPV